MGVLVIVLTAAFQYNVLRVAPGGFFGSFQSDSEALVHGSLLAGRHGINRGGWHLGLLVTSPEQGRSEGLHTTFAVLDGRMRADSLHFLPYRSNVGLQGLVVNASASLLRIGDGRDLQIVASVLLAGVLVILTALLARAYTSAFAAVFLVVLAGSPWITAFARNLYWVSFLWFLPAIWATLLHLDVRRRYRAPLLLLLFTSVFVKSLTGYEYLTSITLFTCSVFVLAPFMRPSPDRPGIDMRSLLLVCLACAGGFLAAFLIHAGMRSDEVLDGARRIVQEDMLRTMRGSIDGVRSDFANAAHAGWAEVVWRYVRGWETSLTWWLPGWLFLPLLVTAACIGIVRLLRRDSLAHRDLMLFIVALAIPLSWFVPFTAHSHVHYHMNYVLWYMGSMPMLLFIVVDAVTWVVTARRRAREHSAAVGS